MKKLDLFITWRNKTKNLWRNRVAALDNNLSKGIEEKQTTATDCLIIQIQITALTNRLSVFLFANSKRHDKKFSIKMLEGNRNPKDITKTIQIMWNQISTSVTTDYTKCLEISTKLRKYCLHITWQRNLMTLNKLSQ